MPASSTNRLAQRKLLYRSRKSLRRVHSKTPYMRAIPYASLEIIALVALANVLIWIAAGIVLRFYPHLSASSLLAYSLGLRHALDADHISAIDLTTRRLLAVERHEDSEQECDDAELGERNGRPKPVVTVGMWFSLGHSTIVILTTILVAATTAGISAHFDAFSSIGGIIGSSVSTAFLLLLGAINAWLLWKGIQGLRRVIKTERTKLVSREPSFLKGHDNVEKVVQPQQRTDERQTQRSAVVDLISTVPTTQNKGIADTTATAISFDLTPEINVNSSEKTALTDKAVQTTTHSKPQTIEEDPFVLNLPNRSCLSSLLRWSLRLIDKPWKIYPLGILFGLGFDTSSEIALLGITTLEASRSQSDPTTGGTGTKPLSAAAIWAILIFPILFTAGMCLLDTADGALMYALYSRTAPSSGSSRDSSSSSLLASSYANVVLTGFTVLVALGVGILQMLNTLSNVLPEWRLNQNAEFWDGVAAVGNRYDIVGGIVCAGFVIVALVGWAVYRRWRTWVLARGRDAKDGIEIEIEHIGVERA